MARKKKVQQKQPRDLTEQEAEYLRNRLDGMEPKAAFVAATPNSDGQKNIPQRASALEKRLRVKEVIEKVNREILAPETNRSISGKTAKGIVRGSILGKMDLLQMLSDSALETYENKDIVTFLKVVEQLSKMAGYNAPTEVKQTICGEFASKSTEELLLIAGIGSINQAQESYGALIDNGNDLQQQSESVVEPRGIEACGALGTGEEEC